MDNFRKGKITSDDTKKEAEKIAENKTAKRFAAGLSRTYRLSMNRAGQRMGVMKVHADGLLDVVFEETGNVKKHQTWYAFQQGLILDTDSTPEVLTETMKKLEGETPDVSEFGQLFSVPRLLREMFLRQRLKRLLKRWHQNWNLYGELKTMRLSRLQRKKKTCSALVFRDL